MEVEQHQQEHQALTIQISGEDCADVWFSDMEDERGRREESQRFHH